MSAWTVLDGANRSESPGRPSRSLPHGWPGTRIYIAVVAVVSGWVLFQNFWRLFVPPVLTDETVYAVMGWRYLHWGSVPGYVDHGQASNFQHPPLAKLLFGVAELFAGHASIDASRVVGVLCTLTAATVLAIWIGKAAGRWTGLLAGALVALLPMPIMPQDTSFGRNAMLDPVAEAFMIMSVALAWFWFNAKGRSAWLFTLLTGVAIGLAAASKENGWLGAFGVVLLGIVWRRHSWSEAKRRLLQSGTACAVAAATFATSYLPVHGPFANVPFLIRFQLNQSRRGHLVGYAGRLSDHPAWWANLWFAWHSLGPAVASAVAGTALVAVIVRRDRLVQWCLAALAGPFVFHSFIAGYVLDYYWVMWMPAVLALSALGVRELVSIVQRLRFRVPVQSLVCAISVIAVTVAWSSAAIAETARVAAEPRVGASVVPAIRQHFRLSKDILTTGTEPAELHPYLARSTIVSRPTANLNAIDTVLVGQPRCRVASSPTVLALVAVNLARGRLRLVHSDRLIRVYVVTGPLTSPSPAQVAEQPVSPLSARC